jgi:hypothetical protein
MVRLKQQQQQQQKQQQQQQQQIFNQQLWLDANVFISKTI